MKNKKISVLMTLTLMMVFLLGMVALSGCGKGENDEQLPEQGTGQSDTPEQKKKEYEVVLYFSDNNLTDIYRVRTEVSVEDKKELPKAALEAWVKGPKHQELIGLIHPDTIIESVEDVNGVAQVSFSKKIRESNLGSGGESMLLEQIAMVMEQFGFKETQILVEGEYEETLLGHVLIDEPIVAKDPENYQWIDEKQSSEIVMENEAFRIYEPAPNAQAEDRIVIRGLARVWEGTVLYELEDGHFIYDEGFTTASEGAPGWGEFEIVIELGDLKIDKNATYRVILFEESAKDGSRLNELPIPINIAK